MISKDGRKFAPPRPDAEVDPRVAALAEITDPVKRVMAAAELAAYATEMRRQARAVMGIGCREALKDNPQLTRRELGELTGLHPTSITNYMSGRYET